MTDVEPSLLEFLQAHLSWRTLPIAEWPECVGLSEQLIRKRLKSGWSVGRTLSTLKFKTRTYKGLTVRGWADFLGVTSGALNRRVAKGWSLERAVKTPVRKANK